MKETAKSVGRKTLSKYDIHVNDSLIEFEIEKEGGVYAMFIRGLKESVSNKERQGLTSRHGPPPASWSLSTLGAVYGEMAVFGAKIEENSKFLK